jgi:hypothetical protein
MILNGVSLKLKDLRIDKILSKNGYENYTIYYSPLKSWFVFFGIMIPILLPLAIFLFSTIIELFLSNKYLFTLFLSVYIILGYLISSYVNNSFVLTKNELIIVNPNFPFRKFIVLKLNQIKLAEICNDKSWVFTILFGVFGGNYVRISRFSDTKKFYCYNLDVDCFDENWTEKTFDDFFDDLNSKNVKVKMKI